MFKVKLSLKFILLLIFIQSCTNDDIILVGSNPDNGETPTPANEITIHSSMNFISYQFPSNTYDSWVSNDEFLTDIPKVQEVTNKIYETFQDDFDFIIFILNEENQPANLTYAGLNRTVSNSVQGVGLSIFNNSASYGSAGMLKGVIQLTSLDYIMNGPFLHELAHSFMNITPLGASDYNNGVESTNFDHWGFTGGSSNGQLGGFTQSTLMTNIDGEVDKYSVGGFGTFASGGNNVPFNDKELYFMGYIPLNEVADFDRFTGITSYDYSTNDVVFNANNRTTITNTEIVSIFGDRVPSSSSSQKEFKLLVAVLTGTPLTNNQIELVDNHVVDMTQNSDNGNFSFNFWEATGGRGTLDADLTNSQL